MSAGVRVVVKVADAVADAAAPRPRPERSSPARYYPGHAVDAGGFRTQADATPKRRPQPDAPDHHLHRADWGHSFPGCAVVSPPRRRNLGPAKHASAVCAAATCHAGL